MKQRKAVKGKLLYDDQLFTDCTDTRGVMSEGALLIAVNLLLQKREYLTQIDVYITSFDRLRVEALFARPFSRQLLYMLENDMIRNLFVCPGGRTGARELPWMIEAIENGERTYVFFASSGTYSSIEYPREITYEGHNETA